MVSTERGMGQADGAAAAPRPPRLRSTGRRARAGTGAEVWPVAAALGATVLALVLGLLELGEPALDYDEAYTLGVVRGPFSETWMRVTNWDVVQAPYYLLFNLWYEVGESEAVLRLPSVACFVASVPVVFALGRRLFDARVGAVAAVLLALNALALAWAQQARSYAMVLVLVPVVTYLLVWALDRPSSATRAATYALVAVVAVYAHFLVGLVIAAHGTALLLHRPRPWRLMAIAGAIIGALTLPAVLWSLTLSSDPLNWIRPPSPRFLLSMLADVTGGGRLQLFLIGPLVLAAMAAGWARHRRAPWSRPAWAHLLVLLCLVLPVTLLIASTYTVKPLLHPRYLIPVVPAFVLVAAVGLVWLVDQRRRLGLAAGAVVLAAAVAGARSHYESNTMHEWRTATTLVLAGAQPGDTVVVIPGQAMQAVEYYLRRMDATERVDTLLPRRGDPPAGERLWVVEERLEKPLSFDLTPGFDEWLEQHYEVVDEQRASRRVTVRRYDLAP